MNDTAAGRSAEAQPVIPSAGQPDTSSSGQPEPTPPSVDEWGERYAVYRGIGTSGGHEVRRYEGNPSEPGYQYWGELFARCVDSESAESVAEAMNELVTMRESLDSARMHAAKWRDHATPTLATNIPHPWRETLPWETPAGGGSA